MSNFPSQTEAALKKRVQKLLGDFTGPAFETKIQTAATEGDYRKLLDLIAEAVLHGLHFRHAREDKSIEPALHFLMDEAIKCGNGNFLIKLGKVLNQPAEEFAMDKLENYLLVRWCGIPHKSPPLFLLSDEALTTVCSLALNNPSLTLDRVRKTRQRLGLPKLPKPVLKHAKKDNGKIVAWKVDK